MGSSNKFVEFKQVKDGLVRFFPESVTCIQERLARTEACGVQLSKGVLIERQYGHSFFLDESYNDVKTAIDNGITKNATKSVISDANAQAATSERKGESAGDGKSTD